MKVRHAECCCQACLAADAADLRAENARLREALEEFSTQHRCGCGHPACNNCWRDRLAEKALK